MSPSDAQQASPKSQRQPREIGCGCIVLPVIVVAVLVLIRIGHVGRQDEAIQAVQELGGTVLRGKEPFLPEWLQPLFPAQALRVDLAKTRATSADLARLRPLTRLESLRLDQMKIVGGDLAPLARLARLKSLSLEETGITDDDLAQLAPLRDLAILGIAGTEVSDAGLRHLQGLTRLEWLSIHGTRITDAGLEHLRAFPALANLAIDERQVTAAGVAHLQALPSLKSVVIHVPCGVARRAWELVAPLKPVQVSATLSSTGHRLWDATRPWEDTLAGVAEMVLAQSDLKPEQAGPILETLAEPYGPGPWWASVAYPVSPPRPAPPAPPGDPIQTVDWFVAALKGHDAGSFQRARAFAASGAGRSAVPALLKLLGEPKQKNEDYSTHHRTAFLLVRMAGADKEVVAALGRTLNSDDAGIRAATLYAFCDGDYFGYGPGWKIGVEQADALMPLLLACSKQPTRKTKSGLAEALGYVAIAHPRHAKAAVDVLMEMHWDKDPSTWYSVSDALARIAGSCPGQAQATVPILLGRLDEKQERESKLKIVHALSLVAPHSAEGAAAAVPALLKLLHDKDQGMAQSPGPFLGPLSIPNLPPDLGALARSASDAMGAIVRRHPQQCKTIVPVLLKMLDEKDPRLRSAASYALNAIAGSLLAHRAASPRKP